VDPFAGKPEANVDNVKKPGFFTHQGEGKTLPTIK
jgi:hypothetical protein